MKGTVMSDTFKALLLEEEDGNVQSSIKTLQRDDLPANDVLVSVAYSTLNYKDGLALNGKARVVRSYPMVPGVDFVGTVVESQSPNFQAGDNIILNGWGVGERYWGGYAQMARVKSDWLIKLPEGLSPQRAMAIGTAGYTAMLCILELEKHGLKPGGRPVAVSGATGGVGSVAVAVLAKLGYDVLAISGKTEAHAYLRELGAKDILGRDALFEESKRPLEKERWDGAVDTVGGDVLGALLRSMAYHGSVAACGNAGGIEFTTSVLPFILRGANLLGIDSVACPLELRREAWGRLVNDLPMNMLDKMTKVVSLEELPEVSKQILKGQVQGRIVVDVNA
jgi:acrylyl-CoA reductase (NADPH)